MFKSYVYIISRKEIEGVKNMKLRIVKLRATLLLLILLFSTFAGSLVGGEQEIFDEKQSKKLWIDLSPEETTRNGGKFEEYAPELPWSFNKHITHGDFDDTDNLIDWTSSPGIYCDRNWSEDLFDNSTLEGAACIAAAEQGGMWDDDESKGYGQIFSDVFCVNDYVNTSIANFSLLNAKLKFDYLMDGIDFDDVRDYVYLNAYIEDVTTNTCYCFDFKEHSGNSDAPNNIPGNYPGDGWCLDYWDPGNGHNNPFTLKNDFSISQLYAEGNLSDFLNANIDHQFRVYFHLDIRLYADGGLFVLDQEYFKFILDDFCIECDYVADPTLEISAHHLDFGVVEQGQNKTLQIRLSNVGVGSVLYNCIAENESFFSVEPTSNSITDSINVNVTLHGIEGVIGSLDNDSNELFIYSQGRKVDTISMDAIIVTSDGPFLVFEPEEKTFDDQVNNTQSDYFTFKVTNYGNRPGNGTLSLKNDSNDNFILFDHNFSLDMLKTKNVTVVFHPKSLDLHSGTLIANGSYDQTEFGSSAFLQGYSISPLQPPLISNISVDYADGSSLCNDAGLLLAGLDLNITYSAQVSSAETVVFRLGDQIKNGLYNGSVWQAVFNTKDLLNVSVNNCSFQINASNSIGSTESELYYPRLISMPDWFSNYLNYVIENNFLPYVEVTLEDIFEGGYKYWVLNCSVDLGTDYPDSDEPPFVARTPGGVPVDNFGGNYGYYGGVGSSLSLCSNGSIEVEGGYLAGVQACDMVGELSAILHGDIVYDFDENVIQWNEMFITVNGQVTLPRIPLLYYKICGIGVEGGIRITPHVSITVFLEPTNDANNSLVPGLGIKISDDEGIHGAVGCAIAAYLELDAGIFANAYFEIGGDGTLYFVTPPDNETGYFDDFVLSVWAGGRVRCLWWTYEKWWHTSWSYKNNTREDVNITEKPWSVLNTSYLHPETREYLYRPWGSGNFSSGTLYENAFPYSNPSLIQNPNTKDNEVFMVFNCHRPTKQDDPVKNMELRWASWKKDKGIEDINYVVPTRDQQLQMDPVIQYDCNGDVMCVFVQTPESVNMSTGFSDAMNASEIAYCRYEGADRGWTGIQTLTNNSFLDTSPSLETTEEGYLLLTWSSDEDGNISTFEDSKIFASFWNGTQWSTPQIIVEGKKILSGPSLAVYNESEALCSFSAETCSQEHVFFTRYQNGLWSNVTQFTTSADCIETNPSVVYDIDGSAYIIWLKKYALYLSENHSHYSGNLTYRKVSEQKDEKNREFQIANGIIYEPMAASTSSSRRDGIDFVCCWKNGTNANQLMYAEVDLSKKDSRTTNELIYESDRHLSELEFCIFNDGLVFETIERSSIQKNGKDCNLSFYYAPNLHNVSPVADFSFSPLHPTVQQIIQFNDTSVDSDGVIVNWSWSFDDGTVKYEQNPTHQYGSSGEYSVCLNVTDESGLSDVIVKNVTVQVAATKLNVSLLAGWNLASLPSNQLIFLEDVEVWYQDSGYSWSEACDEGFVLPYLYDWNESAQNYVVVESCMPGQGYWLYANVDCMLSFAANSNESSLVCSLEPLWNIVGTPLNDVLEKDDLIVICNGSTLSWQQAVQQGIVLNYLYDWNESAQNYELSSCFEPGQAYWAFSYECCEIRVAGEE